MFQRNQRIGIRNKKTRLILFFPERGFSKPLRVFACTWRVSRVDSPNICSFSFSSSFKYIPWPASFIPRASGRNFGELFVSNGFEGDADDDASFDFLLLFEWHKQCGDIQGHKRYFDLKIM